MGVRETATALITKGELKEKTEALATNKETLENGMKYLIAKSLEVIKLEEELKTLAIVDDKLISILERDAESLLNHPIVTDVDFENEYIVLKTCAFDAFNTQGTAVPIEECKVKLNLLTADISVLPLLPGGGARGHWSANDAHPHCNGKTGKPCLGEASCAIVEYITLQDYFSAVLMVLEFLQNVNEDDSAGSKFQNWIDKAKKKGKKSTPKESEPSVAVAHYEDEDDYIEEEDYDEDDDYDDDTDDEDAPF